MVRNGVRLGRHCDIFRRLHLLWDLRCGGGVGSLHSQRSGCFGRDSLSLCYLSAARQVK